MRLTVKLSLAGLDDGEADAVDGDRALVDEVAARGRPGRETSTTSQCSLGVRGEDLADAVDVALDDVAAEARCGGDGALEVDPVAGPATPTQRRLVEGLGHDVGGPACRRRARRRSGSSR